MTQATSGEQRMERAVNGCVFACIGIAVLVIGFAAYGFALAISG